MSRLRLGVVLAVPDPPAAEIDGLRRALGAGALGRIAPHLTLVPPVNVRAERLDDAVAVVRRAAAVTEPLHLRLGPVATFWPGTPVVYLAVAGDVERVHLLREAVFTDPLARGVTWPFVPHVTLADDVDAGHLPTIVAALAAYSAEVTVEHAQVLQQDADRRWEVIAEVPLGGGRIVGRGGLEVGLAAGEVLDPEAGAFLERAWSAHLHASYGPLPRMRPFVVTARREGEVVGVATGSTDDELVLDRLVVEASARAQGIGSHLLTEVELLGSRRGCRQGTLVCQAGGRAAAWYGAHGWVEDLMLRDWRHGRDFLRFRRTLAG